MSDHIPENILAASSVRAAPSPCGSAMASTASRPPPRSLTARAMRRASSKPTPCHDDMVASERNQLQSMCCKCMSCSMGLPYKLCRPHLHRGER